MEINEVIERFNDISTSEDEALKLAIQLLLILKDQQEGASGSDADKGNRTYNYMNSSNNDRICYKINMLTTCWQACCDGLCNAHAPGH